MFHYSALDRAGTASVQAEESLARVGTLGIVAAGLMALLVFML